jgi:hypothetical protein
MFAYNTFEFNSMIIITLLSPFQTLLKEIEATENIRADIVIDNHPEGAVDTEVTRIASENLKNLISLNVVEAVPGVSMDDPNRAGESEM